MQIYKKIGQCLETFNRFEDGADVGVCGRSAEAVIADGMTNNLWCWQRMCCLHVCPVCVCPNVKMGLHANFCKRATKAELLLADISMHVGIYIFSRRVCVPALLLQNSCGNINAE